MRKRFGDWGAALSDAEFACALAAAGVLWGLKPPRGAVLTPGLLASRIWLLRTPEGILPWRLTRLPPPFDARLLQESWRSFRQLAAEDRFRIEVQDGPINLRWVLKQLSRPEVGAAAVDVWQTRQMEGGKSLEEGAYSVKDDEPETDPGMKTSYSVPDDPYELRRSSTEAVREPSPRFLQAQLQRRPRGWYQVNVRIGLPDREWRAVETPFPVPPEPPEPEGHRLTVIFWEPRVCPDARIEHLWLPPEGNSEPVSFSFERLAGVSEIAARITVLHNNRVLQTGLLRAPVGGPWTFTLDATPRTRLEGLSGRTEFDVALVLNHDGEGTARATVAAGDRAAVISLDDGPLDDLTDFLRQQISKIAKAPEEYETLSSPGTLELLRTLAQKGGALHEDLCLHTDLPVLAEATRIHLTSAKVGSFFPVELLYRYETPDDTAGLCPNAAAALRTGECPGGCPADKRQHVCPLGFWGLSRIIERHAHTARNAARDEGGDFLLQPEPVRARSPLVLSNRSLLAASSRASEVKKEAVDELLRALGRRGAAAWARSWPEWIEHVESDRPSLLVLLPHHEEHDGEEILEIGEGERLKSSTIRPEHVRREDGPYPILLLLGCETNLARIAFDSFATRFRDKKAAVVVSTIATILGRHASPAAIKLVELLDEEAREEGSTFGEVMVRLRRKLLETGSPMALGLTAYGDADWILTRQD